MAPFLFPLAGRDDKMNLKGGLPHFKKKKYKGESLTFRIPAAKN